MATQSSREAALARRMALSSGGKTAEKRLSTSAGRVRTAAEARPSRTEAPAIPPRQASAAAPVAAAEISSHAPVRRSTPTRVANPSRELVLARREALSRRGKRADTSSDRNRAEAFHKEQAAAPAPRRRRPAGHVRRPLGGGRDVGGGGAVTLWEESDGLAAPSAILSRRRRISALGGAARSPSKDPSPLRSGDV